MRVAFVGLGVMGYPMAGFLAGAGHEITVYNRTRAQAKAWHESYGGAIADTPAVLGRLRTVGSAGENVKAIASL